MSERLNRGEFSTQSNETGLPVSRPLINKIDTYLRSSDTVLARVVDSICPYKGEEYLNSRYKRTLDLAISIPATVVTAPMVAALCLAKKIEDGGPAFFVQKRVDKTPGESIEIIKIRSMRPNSDRGRQSLQIAQGIKASEDPRNTKFGSFMRKYNLDELPQLFQVLSGKLSMVGIRLSSEGVFDYLEDVWTTDRFEKWKNAYQTTRLGLTGVNQIFGSSLKENNKRYHPDVFYTRHASLGLDLYLLWKTVSKSLSGDKKVC